MNLKLILDIIRPTTILWFTVSTCLAFSVIILNNLPEWNFLYLISSIALLNIGAILINDIGDLAVDRASDEEVKRNRPIASNRLTIKTAWIIIFITTISALILSLNYSLYAFIFSIIVFLFSIAYSLNPIRLCEKPGGSFLFWIVLMISCYFLMVLTLTNNGHLTTNHTTSSLFISGNLLFMGVAEIIAKDLRDLKNDKIGGRNTFVNSIGTKRATTLMIVTAWVGFLLIAYSLLMLTNNSKIISYITIVIGFLWCVNVANKGIEINKLYRQNDAKKLHQYWTYAYAIIQLLIFVSFIKI